MTIRQKLNNIIGSHGGGISTGKIPPPNPIPDLVLKFLKRGAYNYHNDEPFNLRKIPESSYS